jgi:hypothetical protein
MQTVNTSNSPDTNSGSSLDAPSPRLLTPQTSMIPLPRPERSLMEVLRTDSETRTYVKTVVLLSLSGKQSILKVGSYVGLSYNERRMKFLAAYLFSLSAVVGANISGRMLLQVPPGGIIESVQGQFGALVLSVVGLFAFGYFIKRLMTRNDELQSKFNDELRKRLEDVEKENERLRSK